MNNTPRVTTRLRRIEEYYFHGAEASDVFISFPSPLPFPLAFLLRNRPTFACFLSFLFFPKNPCLYFDYPTVVHRAENSQFAKSSLTEGTR